MNRAEIAEKYKAVIERRLSKFIDIPYFCMAAMYGNGNIFNYKPYYHSKKREKRSCINEDIWLPADSYYTLEGIWNICSCGDSSNLMLTIYQ